MQAELLAGTSPDSYRTTAKVVGGIYLFGMVVGIGGNVLVLSMLGAQDRLAAVAAGSTLLAVGAVLWLLAGGCDVAHGILMFPIQRRYGERIAVGYLATRIVDAVFVAMVALLILAQIPLSGEYLREGADASSLRALSAVLQQVQLYAYQFGMASVGFAGLMLCYALYRARLLPQFLGLWGLVGYAIILVGSLLEVLGFHLMDTQAIPGGLWELFVGGWLLVRGFNAAMTRAVALGGAPASEPQAA